MRAIRTTTPRIWLSGVQLRPHVSSDEPYVRLPERIELTLAEAGELLEVLDVAVATARSDNERRAARVAAEMITRKLWPDLGDLFEDDAET